MLPIVVYDHFTAINNGMVCILIGTAHLLVCFILYKRITAGSTSNNIPHQPHALHFPVPPHGLPDRLVVGEAGEVPDEHRAVGVTGGLGVPERIIEAGAGAEEGAEDGVVVGGDVRAVDAARLDGVVLVRVEHRARAPADADSHLASASAAADRYLPTNLRRLAAAGGRERGSWGRG